MSSIFCLSLPNFLLRSSLPPSTACRDRIPGLHFRNLLPLSFTLQLRFLIRYFIHGDHVGISAFVNAPGEASERNAQMLVVGALVPLRHGRMGRSWQHARVLDEMARCGRPRSSLPQRTLWH